MSTLLRTALFVLLLAGTGGVRAAAQGADGIHWSTGDVEAAFASARERDVPIFLYWGAAWCPPCNELKSTLFRDPAFIAKTRAFVPVYIDGDSPGAQAWQDRFGARGYPTLIVFDSAGREITRIPGGTDLARFVEVLDLALARIAPVSELVARVVDRDGAATLPELRLLANYSWGQDLGRALAGRDPVRVFDRLATACRASASPDCGAFDAAYIEAIVDAVPPQPHLHAAARERLAALLADARAVAAAGDFVWLAAGPAIEALGEAGSPERKALLGAWERQLAAIDRSGLDSAAGLRALAADARLRTLRDGRLDAAFTARAQAAVDAALAVGDDVQRESATLNSAMYLLDEIGDAQRAVELLKQRLAAARFGYYWMHDLAMLAEEGGRTDEAVAWLERAWREAEGPATRVQWGEAWIDGLLRLRPDDVAAVQRALDAVFAELESQQAAMAGRNRAALLRLAPVLAAWADQPARQALRQRSIERLGKLCARDYATANERGACAAALSAPAPSA